MKPGDAACAFQIGAVQIGAGTSSTSFYFEAAAAGLEAITASAPGFAPVTQTETIQ